MDPGKMLVADRPGIGISGRIERIATITIVYFILKLLEFGMVLQI